MHDTPAPAESPRPRRRIALIAAIARNGVIGVDGHLPWRLPDDLRRFRALTAGHSIVMGRHTWASLRHPLPGRQNIVVTRQRDLIATACTVAASLDDAIARAEMPDPVFVIGGEALYRAALPLAQLLYLTEIHRDFEGDAHFPPFNRNAWREISREHRILDGRGGFAYDFAAYEPVAH